jgi:hypothetical protein
MRSVATKDSVRDAFDTDKSASSVVTRSGLELKPPSSREGLAKLAPADVSGAVGAEGNGDKDQRRLDRQFDRLNEHLPRVAGERIVWLRKPSSRWVRLPIAILLIVAGVFSFLPVLGLWMLPLGLAARSRRTISKASDGTGASLAGAPVEKTRRVVPWQEQANRAFQPSSSRIRSAQTRVVPNIN